MTVVDVANVGCCSSNVSVSFVVVCIFFSCAV